MKLVIFGLTVSSSWGNGHATLWRGLCRALARHGHDVVFFEKDVPYYASHRDLVLPDWHCDHRRSATMATRSGTWTLCLYPDWDQVRAYAHEQLADADVGMVTSYCPDAVIAAEAVLSSNCSLRTFYDLDTPVTLDALRSGQPIDYLPASGLGEFDLVLSYTGGKALEQL